ncbi:MAG: SCP2 sterol-binding domain-containing protein [Gammaproteobacteria bacterium]|nr:SCP2 sterol-binding domain-containing protein [Gammaproteobacteria bacterium]
MSDYVDLPGGLAIALEAAINRGIALDPESREQLAEISGKIIVIELDKLNRRLVMHIDEHRVRLLTHFDGKADATIRGTPTALAQMGLNKDKGPASSGVSFSGDPDLGQRFQQIINRFEIDWEGELAKITGDVIAHQAGSAARHLFDWLKQAGSSLEQTATDYVRYETRSAIGHDELEQFLGEVDTLRNDVARIEQRVNRLSKKLLTKEEAPANN